MGQKRYLRLIAHPSLPASSRRRYCHRAQRGPIAARRWQRRSSGPVVRRMRSAEGRASRRAPDLHPATVSRRSDNVDGLRQARSSRRSSAHDANKWRHSAILLDTVVGWRSGARRLARPSAERIGRTTGPDNRLCHRWAAIGRAVLGGSSVGARVRGKGGVRDQPEVTLLDHLFTQLAWVTSNGA